MHKRPDVAKVVKQIKFDDRGLVTAVAQDYKTGDVLMVAWMNAEALEKTLTSGDVHYWSRSRQSLWRKGETSGHTQTLKSFYIDCDGDTVLLKVEQKGPACHTGEKTCFFTEVQ